jgi:predicted nucleotidyltransferase
LIVGWVKGGCRRMSEICWSDNFIDREINKIVKRFLNLIIKKFNLKKIIIFGSFARGDYHKGSDLDLVIVGEFKDRFIDRIGKIIALNNSDLEIEAMVYTEKEFQKMIQERRPFIEQVLEEGIVVYEKREHKCIMG